MSPKQSRALVLQPTRKEKAFLLAILILLGSVTLALLAVWVSHRRPNEQKPVSRVYPLSVQNELEAVERQALGTRPLGSVRRTVFGVRQTSSGYQFFVERIEPELPAGGLSPL